MCNSFYGIYFINKFDVDFLLSVNLSKYVATFSLCISLFFQVPGLGAGPRSAVDTALDS